VALDSNQIKLVKESFQRVRAKSDTVAEALYHRLFQLNPNLKFLFHAEMTEQGAKLMLMLEQVVDQLERRDEVEPAIQELARRHATYGVKSDDYDVVGEALLWALDQNLAPNFPVETREAWRAVYALLATSMKATATA